MIWYDIIFYYIILYYIKLYYIILYFILWYDMVWYYIILYYILLYYIIFYYITYYIILYFIILHIFYYIWYIVHIACPHYANIRPHTHDIQMQITNSISTRAPPLQDWRVPFSCVLQTSQPRRGLSFK